MKTGKAAGVLFEIGFSPIQKSEYIRYEDKDIYEKWWKKINLQFKVIILFTQPLCSARIWHKVNF